MITPEKKNQTKLIFITLFFFTIIVVISYYFGRLLGSGVI